MWVVRLVSNTLSLVVAAAVVMEPVVALKVAAAVLADSELLHYPYCRGLTIRSLSGLVVRQILKDQTVFSQASRPPVVVLVDRVARI